MATKKTEINFPLNTFVYPTLEEAERMKFLMEMVSYQYLMNTYVGTVDMVKSSIVPTGEAKKSDGEYPEYDKYVTQVNRYTGRYCLSLELNLIPTPKKGGNDVL